MNAPASATIKNIEGETCEYTEMYPSFRHMTVEEGRHDAIAEIDEQIEESREHAERFQHTLEKATKRFDALTRVEERHANHYRATPEKIAS